MGALPPVVGRGSGAKTCPVTKRLRPTELIGDERRKYLHGCSSCHWFNCQLRLGRPENGAVSLPLNAGLVLQGIVVPTSQTKSLGLIAISGPRRPGYLAGCAKWPVRKLSKVQGGILSCSRVADRMTARLILLKIVKSQPFQAKRRTHVAGILHESVEAFREACLRIDQVEPVL